MTAFERETGNIFSFSVKDTALLSRIKPCDSFAADLKALKAGQAFAVTLGPEARVKVSAAAPCCAITSALGTAGRVLGVQPHAKFDGVDIMLLDLKQSGDGLVTANCLYCNSGSKQVDLAADMRARPREAKLLDTAKRVDHRIVRTGGQSGEPMVSNHGPGLKLAPRQSVRTWMKFPAPQSNKVTLIVPGAAAAFEDVPLGK